MAYDRCSLRCLTRSDGHAGKSGGSGMEDFGRMGLISYLSPGCQTLSEASDTSEEGCRVVALGLEAEFMACDTR